MTRSKRAAMGKTIDQDRLSSLPDDTLTHILSFLTTKQSFSTSLLSTRWKHLFKSVPTLHFDSSETKKELFYDKDYDVNFRGFVNKVLAAHNVKCIQSFRLDLNCHLINIVCDSLVSWIDAAISRNPQLLEINIAMDYMKRWYLPNDLFTCQRLVHLKLNGVFKLSVIDTVCLPALKTFYFNSCVIRYGDSFSTLFSNCPVLEDLNLCVHYPQLDVNFLSINAPSLKRLTICFPFYSPFYSKRPCVWELNVPNLEYIKCVGVVTKLYSFTILKSLRKAYIALEDYYGEMPEKNDRIWELINKFDEVRILSLSGDSMQSLASASLSFSLPVFNKLMTLELKGKFCTGWDIFPKLLIKAPSLEVLVIHEDGFLDRDQMYPGINVLLPKRVPLCFSRSLKEFKLCKFGGDKVEYEWMEYLLKNAKVLEKLTITVQSCAFEDYFAYLERLFGIKKQLLALPRGSKTCQIMVREANDETKCGNVWSDFQRCS